MNKSEKALKVVGLLALGGLIKSVYTNYIQPLAMLKMQEVENNHTVEVAKMQQEMNILQEQSEPVNSNVVGFVTEDYEEEYEED